MENDARIRLSKEARKVFRQLADGSKETTPDLLRAHSWALHELEMHGLAKCAKTERDEIEAVRITIDGIDYPHANPNLRNPVDWSKASAIAVIVAAIALAIIRWLHT